MKRGTLSKMKKIKIRKATLKDEDWILKLENSTRLFSTNKRQIRKSNHHNWFLLNINNIEVIGKEYGIIRKDNHDFISITIKEKERLKGIATEILRKKKGRAIILLDNYISLRTFMKAGFKVKGFYMEKDYGRK
jgi:RimJ/RimL family protein N-acetyltransferase